jgi:hypothetical protein
MAGPFPAKPMAVLRLRAIARIGIAVLLLPVLFLTFNAHAQERKAYKVVDKDGNVTYSQTPPVDGKEAKKISTAPAQQGRGGYVSREYFSDHPRHYSGQTLQQRAPIVEQQRQSAQAQRLTQLQA